MKKLFNILRNIFAILGVLFVALVVYAVADDLEINIDRSYQSSLDRFLHSLKKSQPYVQDTLTFHIQSVPDSAKAAEIREYFQLDTLYDASASTWDKTLAIAGFVARNIPHANQQMQPRSRNAIDLWEFTRTVEPGFNCRFTRTVEPGFNCRLHSILTFELLTSVGIDATFITCLPKKEDGDCHVVNQVWIPELEKWVMVDSDSGGYCATDGDGNLLSLQEIRERYISGDPIVYHPGFGNMAKNTYWFSAWEDIHYGQEAGNGQGARYFNLVPAGYKPYNYKKGDLLTSDADQFWAAPKRSI